MGRRLCEVRFWTEGMRGLLMMVMVKKDIGISNWGKRTGFGRCQQAILLGDLRSTCSVLDIFTSCGVWGLVDWEQPALGHSMRGHYDFVILSDCHLYKR